MSIFAIKRKLKAQKKEREANKNRGIENIYNTPSQTNAVANKRIRKFLKKIKQKR